jgi:hypothetical protein
MWMLVLVFVIFLVPLLSALLGAFTGWVVGWFFADTVLGILNQIGVSGVEMWQVGLFLGFVAGFFRTSIAKKE